MILTTFDKFDIIEIENKQGVKAMNNQDYQKTVEKQLADIIELQKEIIRLMKGMCGYDATM